MNFVRNFFSRSTSPGAMADAAQKVQQIINDNAIVVFSKSYCPYCRSSKSTLTKLGADFKTVELDLISDGRALQDALEELTSQRTVPNIFFSQKSIGGNSDLQSLDKAGKLPELIKSATAVAA